MNFSKTLKVNDQVFVSQYYSWGSPIYIKGVVQKLTPSGMIDVLIGYATEPTRFNSEGRERGVSASLAARIDNLPFSERETAIAKEERGKAANAALQAIKVENFCNPDAETLRAETTRLQILLDKTKKLIEAI